MVGVVGGEGGGRGVAGRGVVGVRECSGLGELLRGFVRFVTSALFVFLL